MKIERVLVVLCAVLLLVTMVAVSMASETTLDFSDGFQDRTLTTLDSPTFDSFIVLPAVFRGASGS